MYLAQMMPLQAARVCFTFEMPFLLIGVVAFVYV